MTGTVPISGSTSIRSVEATNAADADTIAARDSSGNVSFARVNASQTLASAGGIQANINATAKTTGYTAAITDRTIKADASGGAFDVSLPAAASCTNWIVTILNVGASGTVSINPSGSETINGSSTSLALTGQWDSATLHCDGSAWFVIATTT